MWLEGGYGGGEREGVVPEDSVGHGVGWGGGNGGYWGDWGMGGWGGGGAYLVT